MWLVRLLRPFRLVHPPSVTQVTNGIDAACAIASVGSQVAVDVGTSGIAGSGGTKAGTIGTVVGTEVGKACPGVAAAVAGLIESATASGQTAMATVTVTEPTGAVSLRKSVKLRRFAAAPGKTLTYSYTVMPDGFGSVERFLPNL